MSGVRRLGAEDREALSRAGDHHPDVCDCTGYAAEVEYAPGKGEICGGLEDTIAAVEAILASRLAAIADEWQQGAWADAPRSADRVQERLANAQFVTDWLRAKAQPTQPPARDQTEESEA